MSANDMPDTDYELLQRAGALLDTVGRHAVDSSEVALECLAAAEHLSALGLTFTVTPLPVSHSDAGTAAKEALHLLAKVSPATFALPDVSAATDAAQRAYQASGRR